MRESEQKEEDELVVRAIKDLGDRGFFKETKSMDVVMLAVESVNKMSLSSGPIIEVVEENGKPSAELKDNGASVKLNGAQSVSSPAATSQTQQDEHEEGEHEKKTADTESDAIIKAEDTSDSKTGGDEANNFAVEEVSVVN